MLLYRFSYLPLTVQSLVCNHVPHAFDLNILSHIIRGSAYMWCNDIELLLYASYFLSFSKQFSSSPSDRKLYNLCMSGRNAFHKAAHQAKTTEPQRQISDTREKAQPNNKQDFAWEDILPYSEARCRESRDFVSQSMHQAKNETFKKVNKLERFFELMVMKLGLFWVRKCFC